MGDEKPEVDLEEDIKDIDQQDRYEHLYNTRFEQENLVTYPRYEYEWLIDHKTNWRIDSSNQGQT